MNPSFTPDRRYPLSYLPAIPIKPLPISKRVSVKPPSFPNRPTTLPSYGCGLGAEFPRLRAVLFLVLFGLFASNAMAMQNDGMQAGLTTLEAILKGNLSRMIVICGSLWGAYQAYVASKPMLLGGSIAIGLGLTFLMTWANSTWAMLI